MNSSPNDKIAYSVKEASTIANVGRSTLYLAINDGALPIKKFGRRTLILHEDLVTWLKGLPDGSSSGRGI